MTLRDSDKFDALLVVSFGGPEGPKDVMPFLENVTRGRNIPKERLLEVAEHYHHFGGVSPINEQNRTLISAVKKRLVEKGVSLPIYFGNRNWHPYLHDALAEIRASGARRVLAFFTSLFSCYSGCRQYRENIAAALDRIGATDLTVAKVRMGFNHPGFIEAQSDLIVESISTASEEAAPYQIVFTAHSIPLQMAQTSSYERQLQESAGLIFERVRADPRVVNRIANSWRFAYQSRSGSPSIPWLEPDVNDVIRELHGAGKPGVAVVPLGFISDHMEVVYDLDYEAKETAATLGIGFVRVPTVGINEKFVDGVTDLFIERLENKSNKNCLGALGPWHDVCPEGCCPAPARPFQPQSPPA